MSTARLVQVLATGDEVWADDRRVLYVVPAVPDKAPQLIKDGLAMRRTAVLTGRCSGCGAAFTLPNRAQRRAGKGRVTSGTVWHESDCLAADDVVGPWLRRYYEGSA
jgi:hypothetical protein